MTTPTETERPFEELLNALTHGLGAIASAAGGAVLITLAAIWGDTRHVVGASVFVGSLVLLYTASTLYHAIPFEAAKAKLKVFDHCAIYVLIAGTYTPFTLVGLRGAWGADGVFHPYGVALCDWCVSASASLFHSNHPRLNPGPVDPSCFITSVAPCARSCLP